MPTTEVNVGESGIIELSIHNPIANDVNLNGELSLRVPSDVVVEGGDIEYGSGTYHLTFSVKPGESKTITLYLKFPKGGNYPIDGEVLYWAGNDKNSLKSIKLNEIIHVNNNNENTNNLWMYVIIGGLTGLVGVAGLIIVLKGKKEDNKKNSLEGINKRLKEIEYAIKNANEKEKEKLEKEKVRILCDLVIAHIKNNSYSNAITALKDLKDFLNSLGDNNHNEKIDKLISNLNIAMRDNIKLSKEDIEVINVDINDIKRKYL